MKFWKLFTVIVLGSFVSHFPQVSIPKSFSKTNSHNNFYIQKPGHIYLQYDTGDSIKINDIDLTEMLDVIVEYKEQPMFISMQQEGLKKVNTAMYQTMQTKFTNDVTDIYNTVKKQINAPLDLPEKQEEYNKIFFGAALKVPRAMISGILALDYVKQVHMGKKYSVNLKESVHIISADSVWNTYGNQGDSIKVAILDTGIDYMHPDLGKGFGQGFKIIGGYDFINKDNDPKDDHGHGTHVAGIVAADGKEIKGVAPKALLYAYKVLDVFGYGSEAKIISGIERTVDPDNDGNPIDKVDIANLSLGATGNPNDALSKALNNAVKLGVVFCVSAGNGYYYNSIGSPGCAERAITIGGIDKNNSIYENGSKGPTNEVYSIKPDVLAPGMQINSTYLNNGYTQLTGTSMASPHVAGICALIKKQHKDWTPEMIKSAIVSTANSINLDVMTQGNGVVNAFRAINAQTLTIPTSLSFGLDNQSENIWKRTDTILVINKSTQMKNYNIYNNSSINGVNLNFNPSNFSLQPNESKIVLVDFSVNNSIVPDNKNKLKFYFGIIKVNSADEQISIPWAFTKISLLVVNFDRPHTEFFVYRKNDVLYNDDIPNYYNGPKTFRIPIQSGIYNLWALNQIPDDYKKREMRFYFKEKIIVDNYKEININFQDAKYELSHQGIDETGLLLSRLGNTEKTLSFKNIDTTFGGGYGIMGFPDSLKIYSAEMPKNIEINAAQFYKDLTNKKVMHVVEFPLEHGLSKSINFKNKISDFLKLSINLNLDPSKSEYGAQFACGDLSWCGYDYVDAIKSKNWQGTLFMTNPYQKSDPRAIHLITDLTDKDMYKTNSWFQLYPFSIVYGSFQFEEYNFWTYESSYFSVPNNGVVTLGDGIIYPNFDQHWFSSGNDFFYYHKIDFHGQSTEYRISDIKFSTFELRDSNNVVIDSGKIVNDFNYMTKQGKHKLVIRNNHFSVNGDPAKFTSTTNFVIDNGSKIIPKVKGIKLLNCMNYPVSKLDPKEKGKVSLDLKYIKEASFLPDAVVKVFLKNSKEITWNKLDDVAVTPIDFYNSSYIYNTGDLHKFDKNAVDLKVVVENFNGNSIEYLWEPGFVVGEYLTQGAIDSANIKKPNINPYEFNISNNYPNPFNSSTSFVYSVPYQTRVQILVYDILGRVVLKALDEEMKKGMYNQTIDLKNFSSGVYFVRMKTWNYDKVKKILLLR